MHKKKMVIITTCLAKTGKSWYALDSKEYLLPPPCLDDSEI